MTSGARTLIELDPKTCNCHERRKTLIALKIIGEEGSIWALIGHCILHAFTTTLLKYFLFRISWHLPPPPPPGEVLLYMGYVGMCGPKGYGFSAVLVMNRVSILADFGHFGHKQDILHSSLNMDIFLRRSHFSIIFEKKNQQKPFTNYVYGNLTLPLTRELIITVRWSETEF